MTLVSKKQWRMLNVTPTVSLTHCLTVGHHLTNTVIVFSKNEAYIDNAEPGELIPSQASTRSDQAHYISNQNQTSTVTVDKCMSLPFSSC